MPHGRTRFVAPGRCDCHVHAFEGLAARIAPLGWNIDLLLDGRELPQHAAMIDRLPCKLVIDHTGKFLEPVSTSDASFKTLLSLLEREGRWVKLSAPYETSKLGPPHYRGWPRWPVPSCRRIPIAACGRATGRTRIACRCRRMPICCNCCTSGRPTTACARTLVRNPAEAYGC